MLRLIRSILCAFCFAVFGFGAVILGGIIFPVLLFFYRNPARQQKVLSYTIHILWLIFVKLMCGLRLISIKINRPGELKNLHGYIVVANHPSLIDILILISIIPDSICVVKKSLFKNIFVGKVIRNIYLSNDMNLDDFIEKGTKFLDSGYNIVIFPEGTRTVVGRKIHLHRGFAYLHLKSGHPILPIHIENTPQILGKKQPWYDVGSGISVYSFNVKRPIVYKAPDNKGQREMAIYVTSLVFDSIFK